jgi:septum formation protein
LNESLKIIMYQHRIYLASQSPRRAELLQQIAVEYSVEHPDDYVRRMALEKARAGWAVCEQQVPVLGADTAGVLDGDVLCKPVDRDDGLAMLRRLSGRSHEILSAVCLKYGKHELLTLSRTVVTFRELTEGQIEAYWQTGEASDKAGSYGIQGLAAVFVENINGSYSGVVGLPLTETYQLLEQMDKLTGTGETAA